MPDRSDLWSPPVRKWMLDWHSPVRDFVCEPRRSRGGSGISGVSTPHPPALELESFAPTTNFLLLESGFRLLLEH